MKLGGFMKIIGDVHGKINEYLAIVEKAENEPTIQLGDMGVGFEAWSKPLLNYPFKFKEMKGVSCVLPELPSHHRFFRGNHDNPLKCWNHPNYLGDFGIFTFCHNPEFFYIAGGYSVDWKWRVAGKSWWPNEQLTADQMNKCYDLYAQTKPGIVISHECPESVVNFFYTNQDKLDDKSDTAAFLQKLWETHKPNLWVFGHHHRDDEIVVDKTRFVCLNELSVFNL